MSDTIKLLETIGQSAAMRHASAEELAGTLEQADASAALRNAAATGDSSYLAEALGCGPVHVTHHSQLPGHEEPVPGRNDEEDDPAPPTAPEPGQPSTL